MSDNDESTGGNGYAGGWNPSRPDMSKVDMNEVERKLVGLVIPENVADEMIEPDAQQALLGLAQSGDRTQRIRAVIALAGVKSGGVLGILGDDSQVARDGALQLPPGLDAALVSSETVGAPPALIFRSSLRGKPAALEDLLSRLVGDSSGRWAEDALARRDVAMPAGDPALSWTCAWICGLCAAAVLDPFPGDEIPVCVACFECIAVTGGAG